MHAESRESPFTAVKSTTIAETRESKKNTIGVNLETQENPAKERVSQLLKERIA